MNKKDLKEVIQNHYAKIINNSNNEHIIVLDAVKSILGIDIDNIDSKIINWYIDYADIANEVNEIKSNFKEIPEMTSFFKLEKSLLEKNLEKSLENVFYLSRFSEGRQILEFFIEFSLRYGYCNYKYIWHIYRLQIFLDNNTMLQSLNKCVKLIIDGNSNNLIIRETEVEIDWLEVLSLKDQKIIDDLLLFYSIYHTDLIRANSVNKIIRSRIGQINIKDMEKIDKSNFSKDQVNSNKKWILDYINKVEDLNFNLFILLNNIRSCLHVSDDDSIIECLFSQLNLRLCD